MSLLAADIGNGTTVLGLVGRDGGTVTATWRVSSDERRTSDEWGVLVRGLLGSRFDELTGVARVDVQITIERSGKVREAMVKELGLVKAATA